MRFIAAPLVQPIDDSRFKYPTVILVEADGGAIHFDATTALADLAVSSAEFIPTLPPRPSIRRTIPHFTTNVVATTSGQERLGVRLVLLPDAFEREAISEKG